MKKILAFSLMFVMVLASVFVMSGCENWNGYTEVTNRIELLAAINNTEVDKIKVNEGDYGSSSDYLNLVITRPITIKGSGEERPVIYGSVVVMLSDTETNPTRIENLEISHSGQYVKLENSSAVDFTKDGRRGVLVRNGSVVLKNNYIHLTEENPETKLYAAPTGIQISVLATNTVQNQLSYVVEGNKIGVYKYAQTSASSSPVGVLAATDPNLQESLNMTVEQLNNIYKNNSFETGTECFAAYYNYTSAKYTAGAFSSEEAAKTFLGENYENVVEGTEVKEVNGVWVIEYTES